MGANSARIQQLLQGLQADEDRRKQQTLDLIANSLPGQTVEQLGITPQRFKLAFGRDPRPGEVIKPQTSQNLIEQKTVQWLGQAPSDIVNALAASAATRQATGQTGLTTPTALGTRTRTAETAAQTENIGAQAGQVQAGTTLRSMQSISDMVDEGIAAAKKFTPQQRAIIGQQAAYGTTGIQAESKEYEAALSTELRRQALMFTANPDAHPLGHLLKSRLKIDPTAAITAVTMGMDNMLNSVAQMAVYTATGRDESSLSKELSQRAGELSKLTGYKLNPADILAVWDSRMNGKDPQKNPALKPIDDIMQNTADITARSLLTEAQMKGDPRAVTLMQQVDFARQNRDATTAAAVGQAIRQLHATLLTEQKLGSRPNAVGPDQQAWDRVHAGYLNLLPGFESTGVFSSSLTPARPVQSPAGTMTPAQPRPLVFGAPSPSGAAAPVRSGPAPTGNKSLQIPAGASDDDIQVLQQIINSLYGQQPKKP